jgi:hypothetical protein
MYMTYVVINIVFMYNKGTLWLAGSAPSFFTSPPIVSPIEAQSQSVLTSPLSNTPLRATKVTIFHDA